MKHYYLSVLLFFSSITAELCSQNEALSSTDAYNQYKAISDSMAISFPEDDIKTFRRTSFNETQLQNYLSMHFKRMDLLSQIKGHHVFILNSYLHSGNWFKEIGFPKESIKSYKNFFRYYKRYEQELSQADQKGFNVMRFFAHGILAENYANLGMLDSAIEQHHMNMAFTKNLDNIYYPSALNNYGLLLYWHKKELDSALLYFKKAYQLTQSKFPTHTLIGSIRDNIADIYVEYGSYEEARPLYDLNFEFYKEAINERTLQKDIPRLVSAGSQLVTSNVYLNKLVEAQQAFEALETIVTSQENLNLINSESRMEYLLAKECLLKKQNNLDAAYAIAKHINQYADSMHKVAAITDKRWQEEFNDVTIDRIALNFKIDQLEKENKIKSQRGKLRFVGLVSSVFILLLLILFLSRHHHLVNAKNKQLLAEQKLENAALKVKQLHSEIKSKERDLSDFAINLTQNQGWTKHLADQLEAIKLARPEDREGLLESLDQDISNKVSFDSDTQEFFERLDKLSDAFYSKLTTSYPNLSKNEIRLCSLIRLKIESRSIATLQNITMASLNTSRYRLRKKLDLSENVNLDTFIQNL
ncbi:tetratricopeptide repeat protein [Gelidibacter salicanalis]|uniref:Tetratricopeptide repeat protein n=1 Tax=Gelidibacter salicanalis TaxID=291193 RepID=A0A934KZL5_9FLAO|nr:tetratricopeptide repeat protein [Gelidibacter salicanalis]MBJ7882490.1 tetratricopeptide repeat protein [Gelidibacter salicanalis]